MSQIEKNVKLDGKSYWRSLDDLADTPEFRQMLHREFPSMAGEWLDGSRRTFLKIMGASLALAGLGGCKSWPRMPKDTLAPYAHRPANRDPGVPVYYTTGMDFGGIGQGMLATSVDGRPIEVNGNPGHPLNRGSTDFIGQASVLNVYDPDRSRGVLMRSGGADGSMVDSSWEAFDAFWKKHAGYLHATKGRHFAVLAGECSSPSVHDMRQRLLQMYPEASWYEWEPISRDNVRLGTAMAFGQSYRVVPNLQNADVVLSLDLDLFVGDPLSIKLARDFVARRRITNPETGAMAQSMNRLYVVESQFTKTGAQAENVRHRIPVAARDVAVVACELAAELAHQGLSLPAPVPAVPTGMTKADPEVIRALAADLLAHKGRSIIVVGCQQPPEVHALAAVLNDALGNNGRTVTYYDEPTPQRPTHVAAIESLTKAIGQHEVSTLLILSGNPAYDTPVDLNFAALLKKVPLSVRLGNYVDETSQLCTWHLPEAHYLENWGDVRTFDGTVSLVQPMIAPIFGGKSIIEVLAIVMQDSIRGGYEIVQRTLGIKASEWRWKKSLFDGYVEKTAWSPAAPRLAVGELHEALSKLLAQAGTPLSLENLELVYIPDSKVYDGRFANNGWLQELPGPMTRLTWDNVALVNPVTAEKLGIDPHKCKMLQVTAGGRTLKIPAYIMPGQAENSIAMALGYGRTKAGSVGDGVGFDVYKMRTAAALNFESGARVEVLNEEYTLATTQDHFVMSVVGQEAIATRAPELIREATFDRLRKDPSLGHKKKTVVPLWEAHRFDTGYQWGMAVDLTACTGCSACVIACQAENNIPVVGKHQVFMGREMQWIRIDRYFRGTDSGQPASVNQPVMCMQCENAPCEAVCPVGATSTAPDGLNTMTYNRCIGTRYCMNNCPYKVRRFNYFDYNAGTLKNLYEPNLLRAPMNDLEALQKNPQVSIRMRGVMEKCTYCVQRIEIGRVTAERDGNRRIRDGEITPACAQACPTQALVFGNIRDAKSRVAILFGQQRCYGLLDQELGTLPRTRYLPKISNPNPALAEVTYTPLGTQ